MRYKNICPVQRCLTSYIIPSQPPHFSDDESVKKVSSYICVSMTWMKHLTGWDFFYISKALHLLHIDFPYEFYYTGWSLLTIANVRYSELCEVPYLNPVVWWHRCISYDERIWKEFSWRLTHDIITVSLPHGYTERPKSYFRGLTESFLNSFYPFGHLNMIPINNKLFKGRFTGSTKYSVLFLCYLQKLLLQNW